MTLKWNPSNPEDVVQLYLSGVSENRVAQHFGVSRTAIRRLLLESGVIPRSQSEAETLKWRQMGPEARAAQVAACHEATRGSTHTREHRVAIAQTRERTPSNVSPYENTLREWLVARGTRPIPQKAVGPYNCDLAIHPIAVEVFGGGWHLCGRHAERLPERTRYFLDAGWHLLIVHVGQAKHLRLTTNVADYAIRWLEEARRHPTAPREYRVIWGNGELASSGRLDGDHLTAVPALHRTHYKRRSRD